MEYEEGEPCPKCSSDKISVLITYQATIEKNCKTGKLIKRELNYETNVAEFWMYKCRKCGWISNVSTE